MKKHYFLHQKLWLYLVSTITIVVLLVFSTLTLLRLLDVGKLGPSYNHQLDITATVIMFIVAALMAGITFFSGYTLTKKRFILNIAFTIQSYKYEDLLLCRLNHERTIMLLYFKVEKNGMVVDSKSGLNANIVQVNINQKYVDTFIDSIKPHCENMIVEILPPQYKKTEKK